MPFFFISYNFYSELPLLLYNLEGRRLVIVTQSHLADQGDPSACMMSYIQHVPNTSSSFINCGKKCIYKISHLNLFMIAFIKILLLEQFSVHSKVEGKDRVFPCHPLPSTQPPLLASPQRVHVLQPTDLH